MQVVHLSIHGWKNATLACVGIKGPEEVPKSKTGAKGLTCNFVFHFHLRADRGLRSNCHLRPIGRSPLALLKCKLIAATRQ